MTTPNDWLPEGSLPTEPGPYWIVDPAFRDMVWPQPVEVRSSLASQGELWRMTEHGGTQRVSSMTKYRWCKASPPDLPAPAREWVCTNPGCNHRSPWDADMARHAIRTNRQVEHCYRPMAVELDGVPLDVTRKD